MNKEAILNRAVERINEYDTEKAKTGLGGCNMCNTVAGSSYWSLSETCYKCPFQCSESGLACFDHTEERDRSGQAARIQGTNYKAHQEILIQRTKAWCKTFYPSETIEEC